MATAIAPKIATLYELQTAYLEPRFKQLGINSATFQMLMTIYAAGPEVPQAEIARRLGISAPTLSETVRLHSSKGLLEQVPSAQDRRRKTLVLTKRARTILSKLLDEIQGLEKQLIKGLGNKELKVTGSVLDHCTARLEALIANQS